MTLEETNILIEQKFEELKQIAISKNTAYNASLYNPDGLFQLDLIDGLKARINDKLNRIKRVGLKDETEDTLKDLIIYLIHLDICCNLSTQKK
jgi:hypothetical protein